MSNVDLVIRGGTVADGLGGELRTADVAISEGKIVEVGHVTAVGAQEIDAKGLLVAPGFVDIHTHYDGQVMWDNRLAPSSFHGVTTAVMGNCGVGFAPVKAEHREKLIELMEGVEDIPGVILREGLSWTWESFVDYLEYIDSRSYDMDVAAQVPHAPLRMFVMGDRASRLEMAEEEDIAQMRALCRDAIKAGAVGFSTSRSFLHRSIKGDPTPSLRASEAELLGIAMGVVDAGGGVLELAADLNPEVRQREFSMFRRIAKETGLPLSFGVSQQSSDPEGWRDILGLIAEARQDGVQISAQITPRPIGAIITMGASLNPFKLSPTYEMILAGEEPGSIIATLRNADVRRKVLEETGPRAADALISKLGGFDRFFVQHEAIDYEPAADQSVGRLAAACNKDPLEHLYDLLHGGDGGSFVYFPVVNYAKFNLDATREMIQNPNTLIGIGDGGAHVGIISDASFPSYMLTRWSKEKHPDGFDLSWVIKRHTSDNARFMGLRDRGVIAPGLKADINVIDMDRLRLERPMIVNDLPGGAQRLLQHAKGYVATIVSGQPVYREGEATGALPGRLVKRSALAA